MKFTNVEFSYPHYSKQFDAIDKFDYVQLAKHKGSNGKKILLVLDYMPQEDLNSSRLLKGATGTLLSRLFDLAYTYYGASNTIDEYSWLAVTYNSFKTVRTSDEFRLSADKAFHSRIDHIICEYAPDYVVTFGPDPFKALGSSAIDKSDGKYGNWYGVPIETSASFEDKSHSFTLFPTLSINTLVNTNAKGDEISLAGYVARNLVNVLEGKLKYSIPKAPEFTPVLIDSIPKFKKMLVHIRNKKRVAIDTETDNLNRIKNRVLTIQFASCVSRAFVVPIYHKDSPFTPKELNFIIRNLKNFFEEKNNNEYHVYTNAVFDLNVMRQNFGIRFYKNKIWDMFAGEFGHDENLKNLSPITGHYYYSLLNLSMQYGSTCYYDAEFGKNKRKTIVTADLDEQLIHYCCLDVIVPLLIMTQQIKRGRDSNYEKYESIVGEQISDMLQMFSTLEHNGCPTDIDYLFFLKSKQSPLRIKLETIIEQMNNTKGAKTVNKMLNARSGCPTIGLFGKTNEQMFNLRKEEHLQMLFFDALKLKPISNTVKGGGKIDKKFQAEYSDVPEVSLFTDLGKLKKLMSSYVRAFIKQWGADDDMRHDRRIRPYFQFLKVVTGRTSATKPSLHQIPSRGEDGKHIKRLFITEDGRILIKVDYSAHEVRGWSLITGDTNIAAVFEIGRSLRERFKLAPNEQLAKRIEYEGDVHKINAAFFFSIDITKITKEIRNAVKQVVFGLIYQQGDRGLSESTGQTVEAIRKLKKQFLARFPVGSKWFDEIKAFARKHLFVESPVGRRRHLWQFLLPKNAKNADAALAKAERLAVNSPVQGLGSDYLVQGSRCIEQLKWDHFKATDHYPDFYQANSVHDSISISCAYEDFWLAIRIIEQGLTSEVAKVNEERHGVKFTIPLEIDFEIGSNERDAKSWDYSIDQLSNIIKQTVKFQKEELGHKKANVSKVHDQIMNCQYADMPHWAQKQCWNLGLELEGMKEDVRQPNEIHDISQKRREEAA
jgi:DNA polymerase I-like protein with 3'-5' exonuclease and polymerase domains